MVSGSITAPSLGLGNLELDANITMAFKNALLNGSVTIPISLDVPQAMGEFRVRNAQRNILFHGDLQKVRLRARLTLSLSAIDPSPGLAAGAFCLPAAQHTRCRPREGGDP